MKPRYFIWILFLIIYQIVCFEAVAQQMSQQQQDQLFIKSSIPVVPGSKGDVDGNGAIEIFDLIRARDISIGRLSNPDESQFFAGDMNSDGFIHQDDVEKIRDILLQKTVPPPTIFDISPTSGMVGDQITIDGAGFDPSNSGNLVTFGGVEATVVSATATSLVVIVPAGAASGDVIVTVGEQSSNRVAFQVTTSQNAPFISDITPESPLRRQEVTIEGARFGTVQGNSEVRFGDAEAETDDIISWSDKQIITKVPSAAFPGIVTVVVDTTVSNGFVFNVVVVEATAPDSADIVENADGIRYVRNVIILNFYTTTTLDQISDFLSEHDLTQIGIIFRPRIIQARIDDGRNPFELAESFSTDGRLEGAIPDLIVERAEVVSESYPEDFKGSYDPASATFDKDKAKARYYHFAMKTYAGHRLAERMLAKTSGTLPDVRIAIVDGGLGDGTNPSPKEFEFRVKDPTYVGWFAAPGFITGLTDIIGIPDIGDGHGTAVAGFAAGAGDVSLGTGKHVNIRPIKVMFHDGASVGSFTSIAGIEIATADPFVKVINCSFQIARSGLRGTIVQSLFTFWTDEINYAVAKGKILVLAAGNYPIDVENYFPQNHASDNHPRKPGDPTIMNVAATETDRYNVEDIASSFPSGFGSKISVSAPGIFTGAFNKVRLDRDYTAHSCLPSRLCWGTSFSTPLVSGLAAEMILLDQVLVTSGARSTEMQPAKIVEIIESTADDLGEPGFDIDFGYGRINVWKALLATVNGGLSRDISDPDWYGFEMRASISAPTEELRRTLIDHLKMAQVYIDGLPLSDFGNTANPVTEISLYKRVPELQSVRGLHIPIPNSTSDESDLLSTFSITRDEITANGSNFKHLQLRQKGKSENDPPFFELPLDLTSFKLGILPFVSYDDYVFTIEIPRVVMMKSMQNSKTLTYSTSVNGKWTTFPIGAPQGQLEITISYPNFTPTIGNTDIQFFSPHAFSLTEPANITVPSGSGVTHRFETEIPEQAVTGPVTVRSKMPNLNEEISFSSLVDLIVPKTMGFKPEGTEPGDLVEISINVPYYTATVLNTRIQFPGNNPEVAPDRVDDAFGVPDVTNVLITKMPENIVEGTVKILITVDNNERVEFEGGKIELFQRTDYAGSLTFNEWTTTHAGQSIDFLPPPGKRTVPVRFTLNKTYEEEFFFTASIENWPFSLGPIISTKLGVGGLDFAYSQTVDGSFSEIEINAVPDEEFQNLSGSWCIESSNPTLDVSLVWFANFDVHVESEVTDFNGTFWGRPERQTSNGEWDPELLESLEFILKAELFQYFPIGFVQVDQLTASNFVFQQGAASSAGLSVNQQSVADLISKNITPLSGSPLNSNNYGVLNYFVGSLTGNQFVFVDDEAVRFPYVDYTPDYNRSTTYDLTKNGENLTGTITLFVEEIDPNPILTKTAKIVFDYSGKLLKEDENTVTIIGISPPPESGFPNVTGGAVTLERVTVAYNYVFDNEGTVVLRAYKNNITTDILAESELEIEPSLNKAGVVNFENFQIPNVGNDVTTISIFAGLQPAGSSTFLVESNVISYSR